MQTYKKRLYKKNESKFFGKTFDNAIVIGNN